MKKVLFSGEETVRLTPLTSELDIAQDGAMSNGHYFRIDAGGNCHVYDAENFGRLGSFKLDKSELICPHSNSVVFGNEYYEEGDPFPLLYSNIYNNCQSKADRREGTVCVYRIIRQDGGFSSRLVQMIEVGFAKTELWMSKSREDKRPYGNFVVDCERSELIAFTMRDDDFKTRFFRFPLPKARDGALDAVLGVPVVKLGEDAIIKQFDSDYIIFMQGAAFADGHVFSLNGFNNDIRFPELRVFDVDGEKQVFRADLRKSGFVNEPEYIDVYNGKVYISDAHGTVYMVTFE